MCTTSWCRRHRRGSSLVNVLLLVSGLAALCGLPISLCPAATIGFVVDPGGDIDALFDVFWWERLETQGHTVIGIGADESAADFPDVEVFIISNDVNSGDVVANFGLETEERPIITYEWGLWDDIGFSDNGSGDRPNGTTITIAEPGHPLAAGFSGEVEIYSSDQGITRVIENLAPGLDIIATFDDLPAIAVLEPGAETIFGDQAPGLRIATFPHDGGDGFLYTDTGLALLDANINFALGLDGGPEPGDFDNNGVLDVADVNALIGEIRRMGDRFDLNNDSKVDATDLRVWVKDLKKTWFGDANLDLEFNSGDFVQVFQAGKFETGTAAGWEQGDWNGDGVFDSGDFVTAFQDGGFERGPRAAASPVPEPSSSAWAVIALAWAFGISLRCRRG